MVWSRRPVRSERFMRARIPPRPSPRLSPQTRVSHSSFPSLSVLAKQVPSFSLYFTKKGLIYLFTFAGYMSTNDPRAGVTVFMILWTRITLFILTTAKSQTRWRRWRRMVVMVPRIASQPRTRTQQRPSTSLLQIQQRRVVR
ncbi:hypothetical protein BXZ70DRAFT_364239 [Cristinia sonorae]|uniref:Uncharacterized protein n=1 Tax=Cristinia sonorae TaxID=1940300 RepID=A0A8K0XMU4_9AGAR|nr:hypothetical protein BXZ70DRAFT_364239 [Cristinia sonorae]